MGAEHGLEAVGGRRCQRRHNGQHLLIKSSQVARLSVLKSYYLLLSWSPRLPRSLVAAPAGVMKWPVGAGGR